ncbi:hypothetical protein MMC22_008800 [Lobaria immixta]|nr:hypothetical protein [Lobaria immixta]
MSLTALPPELASCVVARIASQHTLCNLARCSRQLYLYTIPHLYRHVKIEEGTRQGEQRDGQLRTLASLLIRRPDLAERVRSFTLVIGPWSRMHPKKAKESGESEEHVSPRTTKVAQAFATAVNASSLSKEEKSSCLGQFSHTHKSHPDLILALLLPALLKVEKLVLDLPIDCDTHLLQQMIQRAACREKPFDIRPPFEALRAFALKDNSMFSAPSTGLIASLLKLPTIQEISGAFKNTWDGEEDEDDDLKDLDSSSSPLTSLDLLACSLSTADLSHILRAPKALKSLFYELSLPVHLDFTEVRHALAPQKNYLESIHLDCSQLYDEHRILFMPMASFIGFNSLKVFKIAAPCIETTENGAKRDSLINFFPPSLEILHLTRLRSCFGSVVEALEHLLGRKSPREVPSLKKLILEKIEPFRAGAGASSARFLSDWLRGTSRPAIGRLIGVAEAQGVSVDVIGQWTDDLLLVGEYATNG